MVLLSRKQETTHIYSVFIDSLVFLQKFTIEQLFKDILVNSSFISWSDTCSKDSFALHPEDSDDSAGQLMRLIALVLW